MNDSDLYNSQVTLVVQGFMQVWNRFEGMLAKELARIPESLEGMTSEREQQPNANYELFYRSCSGIYPEGDITMGEFSNALSVPLSTATRIADWLVDHEYIRRLPDEDDRRVVRIALTQSGKELYKAIDRYIRERMQQILSGLTSPERSTLFSLIGKVLTGLKETAE